MKTIKAIVILGIILGVLDAAVLTMMNVAGSLSQTDYTDLLNKSLMILGIALIAALLITVIVNLIIRTTKQ
jgi:hypothetical protein